MALVTCIEKISPTKAKQYLKANTNNRPMRWNYVKSLAQAMIDGDWRVTHQGIAFNCDGSLKDGQHRLAAIIESGVAITMMVTRGMQDEAMEAIDIHRRRSDADAMQLMGFEVNSHMIAIGRRMYEGMSQSFDDELTRHELIRFVERHIEPIRFAVSGGVGRGLMNAGFRAPVARAWYTKDRDRLQQFMTCVSSGVMEGKGDLGAIALRNTIIRQGKSFQGGREARTAFYKKTESALVAFLERRPLSKVYEVATEQFPLPEDSAS